MPEQNLEPLHTVPAFLAPLAQNQADAIRKLNAVANPRSDGVVQLKTVDDTSRIGLTAGYVPLQCNLIINGVFQSCAVLIQTSN